MSYAATFRMPRLRATRARLVDASKDSTKYGVNGHRLLSLMTPLSVFGLLAVTAMLVFYALERRSAWFILAFAGACLLASAYGFLQGAWPFGLVEAAWSGIAVRRWWLVSSK